ncbi:MAG: metallophosphoesterase [Candidatus Thorarchaeota archaeon]
MKYLKRSKKKTGGIALLLVIGLVLYNFPFLFYPLGSPDKEIKSYSPIPLETRALFIADVHFRGDPLDLGTYLAAEAINYLIIIGDLYHKPKVYYEHGIQTTLQLLNLDTYAGQIYFIWGNHDPKVNITTPNFQTLEYFGVFTIGQHTILAHHGDLRSRFGSVAGFFDYFFSEPVLENLWRKRAGIPPDMWMFTGHSHIAKLNSDLKIANCGGFQKHQFMPLKLGEGILVEEQVYLVTIPF